VEPLAGLVVWEFASAPAAAFAGRLVAELGASVRAFEMPGGSLASLPPLADGRSLLAEYLSQGKVIEPHPGGKLPNGFADVNVVLHDGSLPDAWVSAIKESSVPERGRVVIAVTPYGQTGPKAEWKGSELTLFQAGGEGFLMPSGLPFEMFPTRSPIGVGRYVAHYQGGLTAALTLVAALRTSRRQRSTEWIDISIQDAQLSLNYFTVARHVDGATENRANRAFKYGGVLRCSDGYVEILTLEQNQWDGLVRMMGEPEWSREPRFKDPIGRGRNGDAINAHLRKWAAERTVGDVVDAAVREGVPCGPYIEAGALVDVPQLRERGFFRGSPDARRPGAPWTISHAELRVGGRR
jgi:crotonobetainyl-CoA:carnitine CoA-transferase CaiB-like acyl-CoA transferase